MSEIVFSLRSLILGFFRCVVILSSRSCFTLSGFFYSHSLGDVAGLFLCRLVEYRQWFMWSYSWCKKGAKAGIEMEGGVLLYEVADEQDPML